MKNNALYFSYVFQRVHVSHGQTKNPSENVVITSNKNKTQVRTNENGELLVNVSPRGCP